MWHTKFCYRYCFERYEMMFLYVINSYWKIVFSRQLGFSLPTVFSLIVDTASLSVRGVQLHKHASTHTYRVPGV